jgi:hypothetical protein
MYTSSDEARSDLFLSGAVYAIGPAIVGAVFGIIPLQSVPVLGQVLSLALPLVFTVLTPLLLMRYRKERLADLGFAGPKRALGRGAITALPVVATNVASGLAAGTAVAALPVAAAVLAGEYLLFVEYVISVLGLVFLAVYCTVKARDGFRADSAYLRSATLRIVRVLAIVAGAVTALLVLGSITQQFRLAEVADLVLRPVGAAGAVAIALHYARSARLTTRPTLITPMVIMAIGSFTLFGGALELVTSVYRATILAAIGLAIGLMLESDRSAWGPMGLAAVVAVLAYF